MRCSLDQKYAQSVIYMLFPYLMSFFPVKLLFFRRVYTHTRIYVHRDVSLYTFGRREELTQDSIHSGLSAFLVVLPHSRNH